MIDQEQINKSIKSTQMAITNYLPTPSDKLFRINSVIDQTLIDKLTTYLNTIDSTKWEYFRSNNNLREVITWDADTVIEELHNVFDSMTDLINRQFSNVPLEFLGLQLWKDSNGYNMNYHIDNPIIDVALQLYLFDAPRECGTIFKIDKEEYLVPFEHNTGYMYKTHTSTGVQHKVKVIIPPDSYRYSLYMVWSKLEKNKEE